MHLPGRPHCLGSVRETCLSVPLSCMECDCYTELVLKKIVGVKLKFLLCKSHRRSDLASYTNTTFEAVHNPALFQSQRDEHQNNRVFQNSGLSISLQMHEPSPGESL
jgi:hypothetical protein